MVSMDDSTTPSTPASTAGTGATGLSSAKLMALLQFLQGTQGQNGSTNQSAPGSASVPGNGTQNAIFQPAAPRATTAVPISASDIWLPGKPAGSQHPAQDQMSYQDQYGGNFTAGGQPLWVGNPNLTNADWNNPATNNFTFPYGSPPPAPINMDALNALAKQLNTPVVPTAAPLTDAQLGRGTPATAQTYRPLPSTPGTPPPVPAAMPTASTQSPTPAVKSPQNGVQSEINRQAATDQSAALTASTDTGPNPAWQRNYVPTTTALTMPAQPVQQSVSNPPAIQMSQTTPSVISPTGISLPQIQNIQAAKQLQQAQIGGGGLPRYNQPLPSGGSDYIGNGGGGMGAGASGGIISGIQGIASGIGKMFTPGTLNIPQFGPLPQPIRTPYPTLGSQTFMA